MSSTNPNQFLACPRRLQTKAIQNLTSNNDQHIPANHLVLVSPARRSDVIASNRPPASLLMHLFNYYSFHLSVNCKAAVDDRLDLVESLLALLALFLSLLYRSGSSKLPLSVLLPLLLAFLQLLLLPSLWSLPWGCVIVSVRW